MFLSFHLWKTTSAFIELKEKEAQLHYYKRNHASPEVIRLVELDELSFEIVSKQIIANIFQLGMLEIHPARYCGVDDCVWHHISPKHDEYVLFALLDFHDWKVWCIKNSLLMDLRDKNIVRFHGKQGWTKKSAILPYLTPINTREQLELIQVQYVATDFKKIETIFTEKNIS